MAQPSCSSRVWDSDSRFNLIAVEQSFSRAVEKQWWVKPRTSNTIPTLALRRIFLILDLKFLILDLKFLILDSKFCIDYSAFSILHFQKFFIKKFALDKKLLDR